MEHEIKGMAELNAAGAAGSERLARLVLDVLMAMAVPERFLNDWPVREATRRGTPSQLPVLAWLDELVDGASPILAPLLKEIAVRPLNWNGGKPTKLRILVPNF